MAPQRPSGQRKGRGPTGALTPYRRNSDGRWLIAITVPSADGHRRRRTASGRTPAEARAAARRLIADIAEGRAPSGVKGPTVGEVLDRWSQAVRGSIEPSTYVSYTRHCRHAQPLFEIPVADLTRDQIECHLRELGARRRLSNRTLTYQLSVLRMALRWADDVGLASSRVAQRVKPPKKRLTRPEPLSRSAVQRIVASGSPDREQPRDRWIDLWAVLLGTGCRIGEALGLRKESWVGGMLLIDQQVRPVPKAFRSNNASLELHQPKTASGRRTIRPAHFAADVLDRLCGNAATPSSLLFHVENGGPIDPRNANRSLKALERSLGITPVLPPHSARHTVATEMLAAGHTLDDVKQYLGHSTIAHTSNLYGHWDAGRSREIGEVLGRRLVPNYQELHSTRRRDD